MSEIKNDNTTMLADEPHEVGALGAGGREFESRHSDMRKATTNRL